MPKMQRTVVTLTAGQASGADAVLAASQNRTTLVVGNRTATDGALDVAAPNTGEGMPLPANSIVAFGGEDRGTGGPACPTDAIFVTGFAAGDKLTIWEA